MSKVIDFHSHILPGVDDGSASLEESIAMLRLEAEQGIKQVVATPHFYAQHDTPERFLVRRNDAEVRLREEMSKHSGLPQLSIGAEVHFFPGMSDSGALGELTIDKKGCILLEMPAAPWTDSMYREIEEIYVKHHITPVIAHVDRYISPLRTFRIPERLAELPVVVQANANFFLQRSTTRMALRLLREDKIQLLGSDCHNLSTRAPNLGAAVQLIEKRLGQEAIVRVNHYERAVLHSEVRKL